MVRPLEGLGSKGGCPVGQPLHRSPSQRTLPCCRAGPQPTPNTVVSSCARQAQESDTSSSAPRRRVRVPPAFQVWVPVWGESGAARPPDGRMTRHPPAPNGQADGSWPVNRPVGGFADRRRQLPAVGTVGDPPCPLLDQNPQKSHKSGQEWFESGNNDPKSTTIHEDKTVPSCGAHDGKCTFPTTAATAGMAKNHIKTNIIGLQRVVRFCETPCYMWDHENTRPETS